MYPAQMLNAFRRIRDDLFISLIESARGAKPIVIGRQYVTFESVRRVMHCSCGG